ncbi:Chaperone protein dnaJ A6 [Varanus komodoensis]|nr:Chaperone protein dnaJ A6 [Varanus komodoensis]
MPGSTHLAVATPAYHLGTGTGGDRARFPETCKNTPRKLPDREHFLVRRRKRHLKKGHTDFILWDQNGDRAALGTLKQAHLARPEHDSPTSAGPRSCSQTPPAPQTSPAGSGEGETPRSHTCKGSGSWRSPSTCYGIHRDPERSSWQVQAGGGQSRMRGEGPEAKGVGQNEQKADCCRGWALLRFRDLLPCDTRPVGQASARCLQAPWGLLRQAVGKEGPSSEPAGLLSSPLLLSWMEGFVQGSLPFLDGGHSQLPGGWSGSWIWINPPPAAPPMHLA